MRGSNVLVTLLKTRTEYFACWAETPPRVIHHSNECAARLRDYRRARPREAPEQFAPLRTLAATCPAYRDRDVTCLRKQPCARTRCDATPDGRPFSSGAPLSARGTCATMAAQKPHKNRYLDASIELAEQECARKPPRRPKGADGGGRLTIMSLRRPTPTDLANDKERAAWLGIQQRRIGLAPGKPAVRSASDVSRERRRPLRSTHEGTRHEITRKRKRQRREICSPRSDRLRLRGPNCS
jgi:hypothetical protein